MGKRIIAYPLRANASKWSDWELRLSLRSIEAHWKGQFDEVVIYGESVPPWVNTDTVRFVGVKGYIPALKRAVEDAGSGGDVLWMNDDISFVKDTDWADLVNPVRRIEARQVTEVKADRWKEATNSWRRRAGLVCERLLERGHTAFNFSTHTPYWYEADRMREIICDYDFGYKTPFELAYFNVHLTDLGGTARIRDKFRTNGKRDFPLDMRHVRFINLTDHGLTPHVKGFMLGRFSLPSVFERMRPESTVLLEKSFRPGRVKKEGGKRRKRIVVKVNEDLFKKPIKVEAVTGDPFQPRLSPEPSPEGLEDELVAGWD